MSYRKNTCFVHNSSNYVYFDTAYNLSHQDEHKYIRASNPTRENLESLVTTICDGKCAFAFSSGMAAISMALELLPVNAHVIVSREVYGGTYRLFNSIKSSSSGLTCTYVDICDLDSVTSAIKSNTAMLFTETITNPLLNLVDIDALIKICKKNKIISVFDNTIATPYLLQPLRLGADIVVHSASKALSGHGDVLAGLLVLSDQPDLIKKVALLHKGVGAVLSPWDCFLVKRGIATLPLRIKQQSKSAKKIAHWLRSQKNIKSVYYPDINPGLLSFELDTVDDNINNYWNRFELIVPSVSYGNITSIITHPYSLTHRFIPDEFLAQSNISKNLFRLSAGIEDTKDIIDDLSRGFSL